MLRYISFTSPQIIGMLVFLAAMIGFIVWAAGFRTKTRNIIKNRNTFFIISGILIAICLVSLMVRGINWGLDFRGGTVLEIGVATNVEISQIRSAIDEFAAKNNLQTQLNDPRIQMEQTQHEGVVTIEKDVPESTESDVNDEGSFPSYDEAGETVSAPRRTEEFKSITYKKCMIQTRELTSEQTNELIAFLKTKIGDFQILKQETVGPTIGQELQKKALLALLIALGAQLIYITFRFGSQIRFGLAADIALIHDLIIMVGIYSLFGKPVDSSFLAALLTIIGYSVMDSVVVFDRIRENLDLMKGNSYEETVNISLNNVITRTAMTSATTVITLFALYYFGGSTLNNFAFALLVGVIAGTYSSLFVASPVLIVFDEFAKSQEKKRVETRRTKLQQEAETKASKKSVQALQENTKKIDREHKIIPENYPTPGEMSKEEVSSQPTRRAKGDRKRRR